MFLITAGSRIKNCVLDAIKLTASLGAKYLEFHFGFIEMANTVLADRAKYLADAAAKAGVVLLMETGQETAADTCGIS